MIALLLAWLLLIPCVLAAGAAVTRITGWPDGLDDPADRFAATSWVGLLAFSSAVLAVACVMPVRPWLIAGGFLPLASSPVRQEWKLLMMTPGAIRTLGIIGIAVAYLQSGPERLYDAAVYHNQLVRWIVDEGILPGLGLIHFRMGFSSSWFAAGALFDQAPWESRLSRSINGAAIMVILYQYAVALWRASKQRASRRDWYLLAGAPILLGFTQMEFFNVSTSPNLGVALAIFAGGWLLIQGRSALALVLAGGAFAIKVIAAPVAVAALGRFRWRVFVLAAALAAPVLVANFRSTGCVMFPAPLFCADVEAGVGVKIADMANMDTRGFARSGGVQLGSGSWISHWLGLLWPKKLLPLVLAALLIHGIRREWSPASTAAALGLAYLSFAAPDFRFMIGYIAAICGAGAAIAMKRLPLPQWGQAAWAVLVAAVLEKVRNGDPYIPYDVGRFLLPPAGFRHLEAPSEWVVNGLRILRPPTDTRCGTLPIPCAPYPPNPTLHLCDASLGYRGGFCRKTD
jgi:hypothetical protein